LASLLGFCGLAWSAEIGVMTQNQYVGTDLLDLVAAEDFNAAVVDALRTRAATLHAKRAKALAALIDQQRPALVGLQEVYRFTCDEPIPTPDDGKGCEDPSIAGAFTDQLADTLQALGGRYVEAAQVVNMDLPADLGLPFDGIPVIVDQEGTIILIALADRDVILARKGIDFEVIDFASIDPSLCLRPPADGCHYAIVASAEITLPTQSDPTTVNFKRGFVGIDATVEGQPYRFVTTHLETRLESIPGGRYVQTAQATELQQTLQVLQNVDPRERTLVVGDFNSDSRDTEEIVEIEDNTITLTPPYQIFADDYVDVWTMRPGARTGKGAPLVGYTCCQAEDLTNHRSELHERIDLIFSLATPKEGEGREAARGIGCRQDPATGTKTLAIRSRVRRCASAVLIASQGRPGPGAGAALASGPLCQARCFSGCLSGCPPIRCPS
jgi:hypothetical protein